MFIVSCVPGRMPGSGDTKWHHTWPPHWGDKEMGNQTIAIHVGREPRLWEQREGDYRSFLESVSLMNLDERVGSSQRRKVGKGDPGKGNSFDKVTES